MIFLTTKLKEFIKDRLTMIDNNEWDEFYFELFTCDDAQLLSAIGYVTEFMYECGVDPLQYMNRVPAGFLAGSDRSELIIPDHIKTIEIGAFRGMKNLTSVVIPKNCNTLAPNAFFYCTRLQHVTIKTNKQFFGDNVFGACPLLREITYEGTIADWLEFPLPDETILIHCIDGDVKVDDKGEVIYRS